MSDFTVGFILERPFKTLKRDIREGVLNPEDFLKQRLEELTKVLNETLRLKIDKSDFSKLEANYQDVKHFIESEKRLGVDTSPYDELYDKLMKLLESTDEWTDKEKECQKFRALLRKEKEAGNNESTYCKSTIPTTDLGFHIESLSVRDIL